MKTILRDLRIRSSRESVAMVSDLLDDVKCTIFQVVKGSKLSRAYFLHYLA
jgi:hypothetical protein